MRLTAMRVAALVGLACSMCLVIRDVWGAPSAFCSHQLACDRVAAAARAWLPDFVHLAVVGTAGFAAVLICLLCDRPFVRIGLGLSCAIAGVVGSSLALVQVFAFDEACTLCLSADLSGVVLATLAFHGRPIRLVSTAPNGGTNPARWLLLGATALAMPWLWQWCASPVPRVIWDEYRRQRVFGVVFTDVSCAHCQTARRRITRVLSTTAGGDHRKIKSYYCPRRDDPWSREAALATILAERAGVGSEFALALSRLPAVPESIDSTLADLGVGKTDMGIAREELRRAARLRRDVGVTGLPTLFLGDTKLVGKQSIAVLRRAIERTPLEEGGDNGHGRVVLATACALWTILILFGRWPRTASRLDARPGSR